MIWPAVPLIFSRCSTRTFWALSTVSLDGPFFSPAPAREPESTRPTTAKAIVKYRTMCHLPFNELFILDRLILFEGKASTTPGTLRVRGPPPTFFIDPCAREGQVQVISLGRRACLCWDLTPIASFPFVPAG